MNNKETLQNHNTIISNNNLSIDELIESINNLPEAGRGEPTLQEKTISPSTSNQEVVADSDYDGLSKVTISAVDSSIDSDIKASNIRTGVNILGVIGSMEEYVEPTLQSKNVTPKTTAQTITADSSYDGLSSVSISAVTSDIDGNIKANNIKNGVSILGIEGTLEEGITPSGELTINDNGIYNVTNYASANVEIEKGITPSGTLDITENGTYDVTNFASATVNVAGGGEDVYEGLLNNTITEINSNITSLTGYACRGLSKLKTVNLPNATSIGTYAFYYCTAMTSINAPKVTSLGTYAFYNCGAITELNFPLATGIAQNVCYSCGGLEKADFGVASKINQAAFAYCSNLKALILRRTGSICTLSVATNGFQGSAIANGTGYVYVPKALIEEYKVATNWVNYATQFRAIEDYPDICG